MQDKQESNEAIEGAKANKVDNAANLKMAESAACPPGYIQDGWNKIMPPTAHCVPLEIINKKK